MFAIPSIDIFNEIIKEERETMKTSTISITELKFTKEERDAFKLTIETLKQIVRELGENAELTSITTGEVILTSELPSVIGIIDGLYNCSYFEQKSKNNRIIIKAKTFEELLAECVGR